jgi:hypothetical protein
MSLPCFGAAVSCADLDLKIMNAQSGMSVVCPEVPKTLKAMDELKNIIIPARKQAVDQAKAAVAEVNAQIKIKTADVTAKLKIKTQTQKMSSQKERFKV